MDANLLNAALSYAAMGWLVFPVHSWVDGACTCGTDCGKDAAKHPLTPHGCKDATTDAQRIRHWWQETEGLANVGIATGSRSGLLVLDVDPRHGGDQSLAELEARYGPLPLTPTVATGGGGRQFFFRYPVGSGLSVGSSVLPGLDYRGEGGYVVAPPSMHRSGKHYEWLPPLETPVADAPPWLVALLLGAKARTLTVVAPTPDLTNSPGAPEGSRNATLCRLIGVHLVRDEAPDEIEALALAWAEKCDPPMREKDVLRALASLEKSHKRKHQQPTPFHHPTTSDSPAKLRTGEETRQAAPGWELVRSFAPSQRPAGNGGVSSQLRTLRSAEAEAKDVGRGRLLVVEAQAQAYQSKREEVAVEEAWPQLHADALHGLAGQVVRAIAPETEADEAGVLLTLLASVGNAIGNGPSFAVGTGRHSGNLFVALVGDTASRKGMSWDTARYLMKRADALWASECVLYGLSSGEGFVERIKDEEADETGRLHVAPVKRLLCLETEFARPITAMRREGNTLSPMLRAAWDGQTLEVNTRGKSRLRASNAHVSIVAHVTQEELDKVLKQGVEVSNGFANRFLWCCVRRSRLLPHGGNASVLKPYVQPLMDTIAKAKSLGQCRRSPEADRLWERVYADLTVARPGAYGQATGRADALTVRLSLLYALLDGSQDIGSEHLRAALAVWGYCMASAQRIFGEGIHNPRTTPTEGPLALRLLNAIQAQPGINRTGLHDATGRHAKADEIDGALASLMAQGLAHSRECRPEGGGRAAECWHPGPAPTAPAGEDCEESEGTPQATVPPQSGPASSHLRVEARPCEEIPSMPVVAGCSHSSPVRTLKLEELVAAVRSMGGRFVWQSDEKGEGCVVVVEAAVPIPAEIKDACVAHQDALQALVPDKDDRCYESYLRQQKDDKGNPCFSDEQIAEHLAFSREIRDTPAPDRERPLIPPQ